MPGGVDRVGRRARRERHRDQRVAGRGVVGERARRRAARRRRLPAATPPSSAARRAAASRSRSACTVAAGIAPRDRVVHGQPTRAAAQVRGERAIEIADARRREARMTMPGRAEPALRSAGRDERGRRADRASTASRPSTVVTDAARDACDRRDARDAGLAVDEHRATPALTLRRAPVLDREDAEPLAQHEQQRLAGRRVDDDRAAVAA